MTKKLYLAVTPDRYELPIYVVDSLGELAALTDKSINSISSSITRDAAMTGKTTGIRFKKVIVEIDESERYLFER